MTDTSSYDLVVIGAGPAGEKAAAQAAFFGKRVLVIEMEPKPGGAAVFTGTLPSKTLRETALYLSGYRSRELYGVAVHLDPLATLQHLMSRKVEISEAEADAFRRNFERHHVEYVRGRGRVVDAHDVAITSEAGERRVRGEFILIATGSKPFRPADMDFEDPWIHDSDEILTIDSLPTSMIVLGAGVIGCEYASIFSGLGVLVELVDNRGQLLSFLDSEISQALSYHFSNNNITVRHNEDYDRVEGVDNGVILHLKSGKKIKADALLWCNGRTGNTDALGLENIGVKVNSRGQIEVDENYRTCVPNIYGAGDVIGWPSLASAAHDQGRSAAGSIVDNGSWRFVNDVPTGIYTIPEISSIGKNEQELTQAKVPYEVGKAFFKGMARAQIAGEPQGMLKILFHRDTLEVLGVHCFGYQASEIVHIGQAIMNQPGEQNTLKYFVNTTFNYPTMAEAYRVAAYDGLNRLF